MTEDRRTWLGGSDVAAVLGISPWKTAIDLWAEKTSEEPPPERDSAALRRGKRKEKYILEWAAEDYGFVPWNENKRHEDSRYPWLQAEIDAEDGDDNVEIKTVSPYMVKEWGEPGTDDIPMHYLAQVQHGLGVTKRQRCRVFAELGDEIREYLVERDDELIESMREACVKFWGMVQTRERPPVDYSQPERAVATLKRLYGGVNELREIATDEDAAWRTVLASANDAVRRYEAVADGAKAHLLERMGEAGSLIFDDGMCYRRKVINRKAVTIVQPACSYVDFRLAKVKE